MARNSSTYAKRQRELVRQQKRADKAKKREERRRKKLESSRDTEPGSWLESESAGIVPGPQPLPYAVDLDSPHAHDVDDEAPTDGDEHTDRAGPGGRPAP